MQYVTVSDLLSDIFLEVAMSKDLKKKLNFIENELPKLIAAQPRLKGIEIVKCSAESKTHLDGFMSSIFTVQLLVKDADGT